MSLPLVGPSYTLASRKADVQRTVNMYLVGLETPSKAPFILESIEGLTQLANAGAEVRGMLEAGGRAFVVAGNTLYEVSSSWALTSRGTLQTDSGQVDMSYGLFQLVIVDGDNGYVFTFGDNSFAAIDSDGFFGSRRVGFLDNYFIFTRQDTQQYEVSAINDATVVDPLDFKSAESQPDDIVGHVIVGDDIALFGETSTEFHTNLGSVDFPFERNKGAGFRIGLAAPHSAQVVDNGAFWIGKDVNGSGIVYRLVGRQPQRISTIAVEQALQGSTDISAATAWCYQRGGLTFYCVNAPGLSSTWCYEVSTGTWHERCELDENGQFVPLRATCHMHAFGVHVVGDADGKLYEMDPDAFTLAGDPLVRERISPHEAVPGRVRQFFHGFYLDASTGEAPQGEDPHVELFWSNDSGATWSNAVTRSLGKVGERFARLLWTRLGSSRDRVWRVRFSGNAPFSIVDGGADGVKGAS